MARFQASRVLMVHPSAELYGSDRMLLEAAAGVVEDGLALTVALSEDGPLVQRLEAIGARVVVIGVPVLRKSSLSIRGLISLAGKALRTLGPQIRLLREFHPTVLYSSTLTVPTWLIVGSLMGVPSVGHVHEAEGKASALVQWALTMPLRTCRSVLVNSRYSRELLLQAQPALRSRSRVVLNGIEGPTQAPKRPMLLGPPDPVSLLFVGRLSERKGVFIALDAVELLLARGLKVKLKLLGSTFEEHVDVADKLKTRLDSTSLKSVVSIHAFDSNVWDHFAGCNIALVPSTLPEPFGNTAVEALLAGRPVVVSDIGGLPEAVEGSRSAFLVPAGDPQALASIIANVIERLSWVTEQSLADARSAAERYSVRRYRSEVIDALLMPENG